MCGRRAVFALVGQISNLPICRAGIRIRTIPLGAQACPELAEWASRLLSSSGNRTSMTEANGDVTSYTYDNVYRLTDETKRDSGNNVLYRYQYSYDYVGNRLTENNAGVMNYTYDSNNKLTQLVGPSGTTTFGYDNNGNMTSMVQPGPVTTTYGYNYENRMTSVANPNYTAAYTYSADGVRLRVQESNNANPDRWMQYDGVRPVLEGTLDSGGAFTTLNKYVWEGESYYDPLVMSLTGGAWHQYLYDGLGSTRQVLDGSQTVTDTYSYEAFGNLTSSTGTTANPYKYVGSLGYYQTGSSLMHLGARYYMPEVGRFIHRDPASMARMLYDYASDRPTTLIDPTGMLLYPPTNPSGDLPNPPVPYCKQTKASCLRWYDDCMHDADTIKQDCLDSAKDFYEECIAGSGVVCAVACTGSTIAWAACFAACTAGGALTICRTGRNNMKKQCRQQYKLDVAYCRYIRDQCLRLAK